jgi:hypothetical protein
VVTRNPFAVTADDAGLWLHVAPDDGDDIAGTELLSYLAATIGGRPEARRYL